MTSVKGGRSIQELKPSQTRTAYETRKADDDEFDDEDEDEDESIQIIVANSERERYPFTTMLLPLYQAALKGDWEAGRKIVERYPTVVSAAITKRSETALHIAVAAMHIHFVEELVKRMTNKDLELKNQYGNTALCFAAAAGTVEMAKVMVNKNSDLTLTRGNQGMTPLHMAALLGHGKMVWYLYKKTDNDRLSVAERIEILNTCVSTGLYDVALDILRKHEELAFARDENNETALHILARKPCAFSAGQRHHNIWRSINSAKQDKALKEDHALALLRRIWGKVLEKDDAEISELIASPSRLLFDAAERGNTMFIIELIRAYPDMMWKVDDDRRSIFHIAVLNRHADIYNLVYEIGFIKDLVLWPSDKQGNNLLHLAARLAPQDRLLTVSGAALQMQRELLWFKEVEKIVQPSYRDKKNMRGQTPRSLFTEEHAKLVKQGEEWMKNTANSSMVVAALIATVVFAAAFTVPGGNDGKGSPIFLGKRWFMVFAIADSIALFASSTSILFLSSILTSRYAEDDFLVSLPTKLMVGITMLFMSIIAMMIAFSAALFVIFSHNLKWVPIPLAIVACLPVFLFALLQYRLLADVLHSTYGSRFLFHPRKRMLY